MFQSRPAKATSPREPSALAGVLLKGMLARICWPRCIHRSCLVKGMRLDTAPGLLVMEGDLPAELRQARALGSKERGRGGPIDPHQALVFVGSRLPAGVNDNGRRFPRRATNSRRDHARVQASITYRAAARRDRRAVRLRP